MLRLRGGKGGMTHLFTRYIVGRGRSVIYLQWHYRFDGAGTWNWYAQGAMN